VKADWISGAPGGQSSGTRDVAAREELPAGAACPPFAEPLPAPLAARLPAVDVDGVVFAVPAKELPVMPEKAPVCEPVPELAVPPLPAKDAGAACPPFAEPLPVALAPLAARLPAVDVDDVVFAVPAKELPVMPEKAPVCEPVPELAVPPLPATDAGAEDAVAEEEEPEPVPSVGVMAAAEPGEAGSWPVICPAAGAAAAASAAETSSAELSARIRTLLPFPLCRPRAGRLVLKRTGW